MALALNTKVTHAMRTSQNSSKLRATLAPELGDPTMMGATLVDAALVDTKLVDTTMVDTAMCKAGMCDAACDGELPPFPDLPPLQLSIVNVPYRSECGGFDGGSLEAFFRDRDVECAREFFYVHEGRPHLSCWIEWREREAPRAEAQDRSKERRRASAQAELPLTPEQEECFEVLRTWRLERAREAAVPAYRILSDRSLRHIVRTRPESPEQLARTPGIPSPTVERYGATLLTLLWDAPAREHALGASEGGVRPSDNDCPTGASPSVTTVAASGNAAPHALGTLA